LHQDEVWLNRLLCPWLGFVLTWGNLAGDIPQVFALKERVDILCVIESKDLGLRFDQGLGIADMRAQIRRHFFLIVKERREDRAWIAGLRPIPPQMVRLLELELAQKSPIAVA